MGGERKLMKIAILTCFMEFYPGYSLTGIVKDQAWMLAKNGHEVHLFVNEQYNGETFSDDVILEKKIPFAHLFDYRKEELKEDHVITANKTRDVLIEELSKDYSIVFTHDFVFTGWNLPYCVGVREASKSLPGVKWMHWIHSVPTASFPWWNMRSFGNAHKIIYPNTSDRIRVAEQYRGTINDVRVIPHIKDMRTWGSFHAETCEFINDHPSIMPADILQLYPASVDRLKAKRLREVILIFSAFKRKGFSVCLVVANQWATGRQQKEDIEQYKKIASRNGLKVGEDIIFTSDYKEGRYGVGIPQYMVEELLRLSNLFIFPTREESFGLVMPEAALSSGGLCVLNKSLDMMKEVSGYTTLYFDFGSFHMTVEHADEDKWITDVASIILGRMLQNEAISLKTFCRQRYNIDNLYNKFYAPIFAESVLWV
jgi:hypothetical protein